MYNHKERHWNGITISIPDNLLDRIDTLRHDISRSKYIQRVIQQHLQLVDVD
jgi:metal-responsive CopG/Arc/MetJ family transcriptional regulator